MCQQNRMLVSDLNCLVLKELNKKTKQKKWLKIWLLLLPISTSSKRWSSSRLGLFSQKISRILELDTDANRSGWMCILNFDVIGSFSFIYCSLKIIKKDIKILSPENIYVQLFNPLRTCPHKREGNEISIFLFVPDFSRVETL